MSGPAFEALTEAMCSRVNGYVTTAARKLTSRYAQRAVANPPLTLSALIEAHGISEIMRMLSEGGWVERYSNWSPTHPRQYQDDPYHYNWRLAPVAEDNQTTKAEQ